MRAVAHPATPAVPRPGVRVADTYETEQEIAHHDETTDAVNEQRPRQDSPKWRQ
jgi:hypothetical protein